MIQSAPLVNPYPVTTDPAVKPDEWEDFWRNAVNGTMFHSLRFLSYHPPNRFNHHHLTFRRKGNLAGIFPGAVIIEEDGSKSWVSHPGASYGGPAWSSKLKYHHLESLVEALAEYAVKQGFNRIKLTPPPVIYNEHPVQDLDFALARFNFKTIRQELTQAVHLGFNKNRLLNSFVNKTRTACRSAIKNGLQFRIIERPDNADLDRFWEILVENRRGLGVVPAHNRQEIERLHKLMPNRLMLAVIEHEERIIAVIWNFICNRSTVLEFYMAHETEYQHLRPVPLLTYHTMLWAKQKGFRYLDFGISSVWSDPTWGLLRFKENFGSRHFLRTTYLLEL